MSEVEKMYENAIGKVCTNTIINPERCNKRRMTRCCGCDYYAYPPFTAEKQIAILKLLTQQCDLTISHFTGWEFIHFDGQEPTQVKGKDFVETFAKLINAYWQDLTESEQEQIRSILNG